MVVRGSSAALAVFALLFAWLATDCAYMCSMAHDGMHVDCWVARHSALPCDTGTLILLVLLAMMSFAAAIYLWSVTPRRV